MKHIVQFSGGAASAYVAWLVVQEFGTENTVLLFHDTKAEHPDAYRFRKQVSEFVGVPITDVSDGRDVWEVIKDNGCLPSFHIPFCTRILKQEPAEKYYKSNLNEPNRWKNLSDIQSLKTSHYLNLRQNGLRQANN